MIGSSLRKVCAAPLVALLSGCVAFHSLPTRDYAETPPPDVVRIVFDENGDPWPLESDATALALLPQDLDKSRHFRLSVGLARSRAPYDRAAILDAAARRIAPGGRVVVLIKGFNNSYGSFRSKFAATRAWLGSQGARPNVRYVEVYWDALHRAGGKVPYPVGLFPRARGNAERMAQCGLRDLLGRLPQGTEVSFIAHSLGAVAALDAVTQPASGWQAIKCTGNRAPPSVPTNLSDVRIVAFAPAVGAGQLGIGRQSLDARRFAGLRRIYIGWNPNDPAVTKHGKFMNLPDTLGGDTRLGGNRKFVVRSAAAFADAGTADLFRPLEFDQSSHELATYLAQRDKAACLLWAAKALPDKPVNCLLEQ